MMAVVAVDVGFLESPRWLLCAGWRWRDDESQLWRLRNRIWIGGGGERGYRQLWACEEGGYYERQFLLGFLNCGLVLRNLCLPDLF